MRSSLFFRGFGSAYFKRMAGFVVAKTPTSGRQDKSADLWPGACGWSGWRFQAFDHDSQLALNAFSSGNSNFHPPSHGQAGLFQP